MKNFVYNPDLGKVGWQSDIFFCDGDVDHIWDNLDQDNAKDLQEKHQDALDSSVSVQIEGIEALDSVHIPDDSIDAGGSIGLCATGTSNFTQKMNNANVQSTADEYLIMDDGETQDATADATTDNWSVSTDNNTIGTGGSPNAKSLVSKNNE